MSFSILIFILSVVQHSDGTYSKVTALRNGLFVVSAKYRSSIVSLVIDSGSPVSGIKHSVVVKEDSDARIGDALDNRLGELPNVFENEKFFVLPDGPALGQLKVDGLIGMDVLKHLSLGFDLETLDVKFFNRESAEDIKDWVEFPGLISGDTSPGDLTSTQITYGEEGVPRLQVGVGTASFQAILDTGSAYLGLPPSAIGKTASIDLEESTNYSMFGKQAKRSNLLSKVSIGGCESILCRQLL